MALLDWNEAGDKRSRLKEEGKTVVFTNGCFDLLHKGHVHILREAKQQGDYLLVGMNTDASVRRLKGESRPVKSESNRAEVLDAMQPVDDVVLFEQDTPLELIEALTPDVLVKGSDYEPSEVVGAKHVRTSGGRLHRVDLLPGQSTTSILETIRNEDESSGEDES